MKRSEVKIEGGTIRTIRFLNDIGGKSEKARGNLVCIGQETGEQVYNEN